MKKKKLALLFLILFFFVPFISPSEMKNCTQKNNSVVTIRSVKKDTPKSQRYDMNQGTGILNWQKNMPWLGAILLGLLTIIANYIISRQYRKSNLEITELQIKSSRETTLSQIENIRKGMELDFNKTVLSGNRQLWINDLRELISKILSKTMTVSLTQNLSQDEFEDLKFLVTKVELMLNKKKDKRFIIALTSLEQCYLDILMGNGDIEDLVEHTNNVKQLTQITLKTEWERVKKGQ